MTSPVNDLQRHSLVPPSGADFNQKNPVDCVVDQMVRKMKKLAKKDACRSSYPGQCYVADKSKLGNKRLVVRQPETIKEWRQGMKGLLRQYLALKFPEQEKVLESEPYGVWDEDEKSSFPLVKPLTVSTDLDRQDLDISEIRFKIKTDHGSSWYRLPQHSDSTLILQKKGLKRVAPLSEKERLIFQESFLARLFQGSHLEYINHRRQPEKKPDSFWSGWKTQIGAVSGLLSYLPQTAQRIIYNIGNVFSPVSPPWAEYQTIIHPVIRDAALEILNNAAELQPNVVEICGGEGELAIGIAEEYRKPMNYYLLEYNDLSLQRAKDLVASKNQEDVRGIIPIKTDVTNQNDYFVDTAKKEPMQKESIDLIVGSGALTECVLENRERALAVARKCYELLKPKGKMILAGHASSLLDSEDFSALGFHVVNRSFIGRLQPFSTDVNRRIWVFGAWNKQFYILEKI